MNIFVLTEDQVRKELKRNDLSMGWEESRIQHFIHFIKNTTMDWEQVIGAIVNDMEKVAILN